MPRVVGELTVRGIGQCKGAGRALVGTGVAGKSDRSKERERVGASAIFPLECFRRQDDGVASSRSGRHAAREGRCFLTRIVGRLDG
jgi:hypothetical protein